MACFLVPGTEAVVVTAVALILRKYELDHAPAKVMGDTAAAPEKKTGFARKLFWLAGLLWGGVALLAFEHLWHGEVIPTFPFLTAATEGPAAVSEMLHEMFTVGVTMAILVTVIWAVMVIVAAAIERRPEETKAEANA